MTKPHVYGMDLLRGVLTAHDKRHVNLSVSQIGTAVGASSDASGLMAVTGELGSYSPYCLFHQMKLQRHGETLKPGWQCPGGGELNMGGGQGEALLWCHEQSGYITAGRASIVCESVCVWWGR